MSDTALLSVVKLLEELHQVTDWYMLGVYLELPREELSQIEKQFLSHGLSRCKTELFDLWLRSNPKASWELVAVALEKSGEKVLAENVRTRHSLGSSLLTVPSGAKQSSQYSSTVTVELEKPLVKRFTKLERNFAVIVKDIENSLEDKQTPLKDLHRFLKARLGQGGNYMQATSIDELFQQISPHYCFLNTTLLEDIIDEFIGEPLKHQLEKYEEQLDDFTSSTEITHLTERIQSHRPPNTDQMPQVVLKLTGRRWLDVTIKRFQDFVNQILGAAASDLTHIRVQHGCICISWLTHESVIPTLVALAQQKVAFMRHLGVLKMTVGDIAIFEKKGENEEEDDDADFSPALLRTTTAGCVEAVEFLLVLGADPNYASEDGATPLMIACEKGTVNITKVLLREHKKNVNTQDRVGKTALMKVCGSPVSSEDLVKLLIQSGADVHTQTRIGWTALTYATRRGHSNIVHLLLNKGADVNTGGGTALMLACSYSHPDIVQLLLSYGADPNIQNRNGYTALMNACYVQLTSAVEILLAHGADPNIQDLTGHTALMFACSIQLTSAVELLLAHGADPNLQSHDGWTALMYACKIVSSLMDPSIPILLLSAGANPNVVSVKGFTALMTAAEYGYLDGVQALVNAKAGTNMHDKYGYTALHFAVGREHLSVIELLLAAGANASLVDVYDRTALDLALAGNHHDVCQLLLMHMGSPNVPETEHIQHQTQQLRVQSQSTSSHPPYHHSIQQLREALHHPLSPAGTFKHWEDDEEEDIRDVVTR